MRQGSGNNSNAGRKVEPSSRAINPGGVGQIGIAQGSHVTAQGKETGYRGEDHHLGRGFMAPGIKSHSKNNGSQGSY